MSDESRAIATPRPGATGRGDARQLGGPVSPMAGVINIITGDAGTGKFQVKDPGVRPAMPTGSPPWVFAALLTSGRTRIRLDSFGQPQDEGGVMSW